MCQAFYGATSETSLYLQIADLLAGAKVRLLALAESEPEENLYGRETRYQRKSAQEWYSFIRSGRAPWEFYLPNAGAERLFSVTNATFFSRTETETTAVPFPLLSANNNSFGVSHPRFPETEAEEVERGLASDYEAPKEAFELGYTEGTGGSSIQKVAIRPFRARYGFPDVEEILEINEIPAEFEAWDGAVSFTPEYRINELARRNYVGIDANNVYMLSTRAEYTNAEVIEIMHGIDREMKLIQMDGGGSTQLYSEYRELRSNIPFGGRKVASVLAFYRSE